MDVNPRGSSRFCDARKIPSEVLNEAVHQGIVHLVGLGLSRQLIQPVIANALRGYGHDEQEADYVAAQAAGLIAASLSTLTNNGLQYLESKYGVRRFAVKTHQFIQKGLMRPGISAATSIAAATFVWLGDRQVNMLGVTALSGLISGGLNARASQCHGSPSEVPAQPGPNLARELMFKGLGAGAAFVAAELAKPLGALAAASAYLGTWYLGSQTLPEVVTSISDHCWPDDANQNDPVAAGPDRDPHASAGDVSVNIAVPCPTQLNAPHPTALTQASGSPLSADTTVSLGSPESGGGLTSASAPGSAVTPVEIRNEPADSGGAELPIFLGQNQTGSPESDGGDADNRPTHLHISPQKNDQQID